MNAAAKLKTLTTQGSRLWASTQVSHRGKYSIERTLALQEYAHSTTQLRSLIVAVCTPIPALLGSLAIESLPLYEPSAGWIVNFNTWIRAAMLGGLLSFLIALDVRHLVPGWLLSSRQVAIFPFIMTILTTPVMILLGALWIYPVPFMTVLSGVPFSFFCILTLCFMVGKNGLTRLNRGFPGAISRHIGYVSGQSILVIVYPVFQAFFNSINHSQYTLPVLVLMLPCIKITLKQLAARQSKHLEDLIPELVVVSVELFNALYLATCIQRLNSSISTLVVFLIDVLQSIFALLGVHTRSAYVWRRYCALTKQQGKYSLLEATREIIKTPKLNTNALTGIHLHSCVPHTLSGNSINMITILEQRRPFHVSLPRERDTRRVMPHIDVIKQQHRSAPLPRSVVPIGPFSTRALSGRNGSSLDRPSPSSCNLKSTLLAESQGVLFAIEYYVLAEYYELVSQLFYAGYLAGLSKLPVAKYHAELADISDSALTQTLVNNLLYSSLKFASFIALLIVLHRACGHNGLVHLSFVLESRMLHIQTKMMVWILMVMGFRVVHFGK